MRDIKTITATIAIALVVTGCASAPAGEAEAVRANECGGETIDHSAAITSAHDLLIDAPVDVVWNTLTDVEGWGAWQQAVTSIDRVDSGDFDDDSQFVWTTPVPESQLSPADTLTITSSVQQVHPEDCLLWQGPAMGQSIQIEEGVHLWTFTEVDGGTMVHTEESWDAALLSSLQGADAVAAEEMLGGGLAAWLQNLKTEAESL